MVLTLFLVHQPVAKKKKAELGSWLTSSARDINFLSEESKT